MNDTVMLLLSKCWWAFLIVAAEVIKWAASKQICGWVQQLWEKVGAFLK